MNYSTRGVQLYREQILEMMGTEDGTFLVTRQADGSITLERVEETTGYEIAYDSEIAPSHHEHGSAFLEPGERIGRWTDDGRVVIDRVMYVKAPRQIALSIGIDFNQAAIYDWAAGEVISL